MLIIGCDFHPGFQQIAIFDNTGEIQVSVPHSQKPGSIGAGRFFFGCQAMLGGRGPLGATLRRDGMVGTLRTRKGCRLISEAADSRLTMEWPGWQETK